MTGDTTMLKKLRQQVCQANKLLPKHGLVKFTWGNVSALDRKRGLMVIKPSGVEYKDLTPSNMIIVDLEGNVVEGEGKPSSDTTTHLYMYNTFLTCDDINCTDCILSIVHTHSTWATIFAQAGVAIPAYGTTHADYFYGEIPCTRALTKSEINGNYELKTGKVIEELFADNKKAAMPLCGGLGAAPPPRDGNCDSNFLAKNKNHTSIPGALVKNHGVFAWGKNPHEAVYNATVLEEVAKMAYFTKIINPGIQPISDDLLTKHFERKHGKNATYGQNTQED